MNVKDSINFIEIDFKTDNFMWVLKSDCVKWKDTLPTPLDLWFQNIDGCCFSGLFVVCMRRVCCVGYQESSQQEKKMN